MWQPVGYFWWKTTQTFKLAKVENNVRYIKKKTLKKKKNQNSKIQRLPCDHSGYLKKCDIWGFRESAFFK